MNARLSVRCVAFADDRVPQDPGMRPDDVVGELPVLEDEVGFDVGDSELWLCTRRVRRTSSDTVRSRQLGSCFLDVARTAREENRAEGWDNDSHRIGQSVAA